MGCPWLYTNNVRGKRLLWDGGGLINNGRNLLLYTDKYRDIPEFKQQHEKCPSFRLLLFTSDPK